VAAAQIHVFVGRRICEFRAREVNHLAIDLKKGYWADGGESSDYATGELYYPLVRLTR
jgi:hypothetical protein